MRRKDREITDIEQIKQYIQECDCIRLGIYDEVPYIVPLNFGFDEKHMVFYMHCASVGKKLDLIRKNPRVAFEMDCHHELIVSEKACGYSYRFRSIMGVGIVSIVQDEWEKQIGLNHMMKKYSQQTWDFDPRILQQVTVLKLQVEQYSCKEHL